MVMFRGINIRIVSQFDIRKLPEFSPRESPDPFKIEGPLLRSKDNTTASCYVPIYPGSQIWFEYSIDGPHPPKAAYFFKLLLNRQVVASWDCTAQHGYHGKTAYALESAGTENFTGQPVIRRKAFQFSSEEPKPPGSFDDCIEIRIHRIEHRQRMQIIPSAPAKSSATRRTEGALCLTDGGSLEPGFPKRHYKYQLLDPTDEPYATFCFYYRTYEYLDENNIIDTVPDRSCSISSSSTVHDEPEELSEPCQGLSTSGTHLQSHTPDSSRQRDCEATTPPRKMGRTQIPSVSNGKTETNVRLTLRSSEDDLSTKTKDSVEDLQLAVPRSSRSPRSLGSDIKLTSPGRAVYDVTLSPSKAQQAPRANPRKKKLTINLNGTEFSLETRARPMSPFTSSGILRKMPGPTPPSAPAALTEFGPSVSDEVEEGIRKERLGLKEVAKKGERTRTTRDERGGRSLIGFLVRRTVRSEQIGNALEAGDSISA